MQLKRWNIRKNATRDEWQRYFSTNKDLSIPNSLDVPGESPSPVILNKSTKSKKRASRWASSCNVSPDAAPAPQVSGSIPPGNENTPVLNLNEQEPRPEFRDFFQNMPDAFYEFESLQLLHEPSSTDNFTHSLLGSPSQASTDAPSSLDLIFTSSGAPGLQSPVCGPGNPDLADFSMMGLPAGNSTAIIMLQNIRHELPSAQLEQSILLTGIILERSATQNVFGVFASRVIAGILSSKDQSMVQQIPDLKRFLNLLEAQTPGESSALITDAQAFETNFARVLLSSMLNGFFRLG